MIVKNSLERKVYELTIALLGILLEIADLPEQKKGRMSIDQ